jgi:hypothetical protein
LTLTSHFEFADHGPFPANYLMRRRFRRRASI